MRVLRIFQTECRARELAQLLALGVIRRHHQDDFESGPVEGLGMTALPAALPLAAVKFQRNNDREQRGGWPGFCLTVQHPATIGSKGICPIKFIPRRGRIVILGTATGRGIAGLRTWSGCASRHPPRLPIIRNEKSWRVAAISIVHTNKKEG